MPQPATAHSAQRAVGAGWLNRATVWCYAHGNSSSCSIAALPPQSEPVPCGRDAPTLHASRHEVRTCRNNCRLKRTPWKRPAEPRTGPEAARPSPRLRQARARWG